MPSTYLNLTNQLLRRLNEVEIAETEFLSTRGVQTLAKDAIRNSIGKINLTEYEWPWNAAEFTQVLVVGQEEYSWPSDYKVADFNSFQLQKDDSLGINNTRLQHLERDQYYEDYRDNDDDQGASGLGIPKFVFPGHGNGYGVTPSPDEAYTLKFRYYMTAVDLTAATDETRIPNIYDFVVVEGGLYYMYMYRDNPEAASIASQVFQQGIKEMQGIGINKYERIRDTRVSRKYGLNSGLIGY